METKTILQASDLPIPAALQKRVAQSISTYNANGIKIEIVSLIDGVATVVATQERLINGFLLNNHQLYERVVEVFSGIDDIKFNILPNVYSIQLSNIDLDYIEAKMEEFGIKRKDLIKQLGLTKDYISLLFSDESNKRKIGLSNPMKSLFFYYFLTYELNRDFREQLT